MWTPKPLIFCLITSPLLHASYHPLQMKASSHLSSGPRSFPSAQGHLSPTDQPPSAASPSHHQPLHMPTFLPSPKETVLSSILPSTFCYISHLPSLEKALHTWVSTSAPPTPSQALLSGLHPHFTWRDLSPRSPPLPNPVAASDTPSLVS